MVSLKTILMDIEGTTTDIDFVHKTLFPFSKQRLPSFLASARGHPTLWPVVDRCLQATATTILQESPHLGEPGDGAISQDRITRELLHWIEIDRKHPALKELQGLLWEQGYRQGDFKGHVYPEVPDMLRLWRRQGLSLSLYSSGSIQAQKLLFSHSVFGDLTPLFAWYFDTGVGPKKDPDSYRNILSSLAVGAHEVVFLTDVMGEGEAANAVGIKSVLLDRKSIQHSNAATEIPTAADFVQVDRLLGDLFPGRAPSHKSKGTGY